MFSALKLQLRLLAGSVLRAWMRGRSAPWPARRNTVTLVLEPHPDDGALGCGGLIAGRAAAGETVHVAYITDGSASHPHHPAFSPEQIAALRADEARKACAILGVPAAHLSFFGAPDGKLPRLAPEIRAVLRDRIRDLVERIAPAEVLITSRLDGSSEHTAACELVTEAIGAMHGERPRILQYIVWSRWSPRLLLAALRAPARIYRHALAPDESVGKHAALRAYASQFEPVAPWTAPVLPEGFARMFRAPEEYFFEFDPL